MINSAVASNLSINVYLKLKANNPVKEYIHAFNHLLEQQHLLTTYHIFPYLQHHPLHLTLYLTHYSEQQIPIIIKKMDQLAQKNTSPIVITSKFIANKNGYLMLTIKNEFQIQQLSNAVLYSLNNLRNKQAIIPQWAADDLDRKLMFAQYGSPNVLNYFNPHFSIFNATMLSPAKKLDLYSKLNVVINQFIQKNPQAIHTRAYAIGIGITDEQGQIIKELKSINLLQSKT